MDAQFSQADLNRRLVEAVIKLRVRDCRRLLLVREDQIERVQQAATARLLSGLFSDASIDPLTNFSLEMIEGEVELEVTDFSSFIALACLNLHGLFGLGTEVAVNYVNPETRETCTCATSIRSLGKSFPFTKVFQPAGQSAFVSDAGRLVLDIAKKSKSAPEARYGIGTDNQDALARLASVATSSTLPAGWGLEEGGPGRPRLLSD